MSPYRKSNKIELYEESKVVSFKLYEFGYKKFSGKWHWLCPVCGTYTFHQDTVQEYCEGRGKFSLFGFSFGKKKCPYTKEHLHSMCNWCKKDVLISTFENLKEEIITENI